MQASATQPVENITSQKLALYCNYIFLVLLVGGWFAYGHFWAPPGGDIGLEATKKWFTETHQWQTIIGCSLGYIAAGFLTPGSVQCAIMLSKIEGRYPVWSIVMGVSGVFISLILFLNCCAWIVGAYRVETSPDVIQAWYDWAWFAFLLGWIYLMIEMIATGIVELMDKREVPMIPRWFSWLTIASGATLFTAAGPAFFKSGLFSYNGMLGYYLPVVVWGTYIFGTTYFMLKELDRVRVPASVDVPGAVGMARA